jgi:hypothetical protein
MEMNKGRRTNMLLLVGGNWNNNTNAGVRSLNWNNNRTNANNNIGFRSDYDSTSKCSLHIVESQGCAVLHKGEIHYPSFLVGVIRRPAVGTRSAI